MQCLELHSLLGWYLGKEAQIDLTTQKFGWSYWETFRRDKEASVPPCYSSASLDVRDQSCFMLTCAMAPMLL